MPVEEGVGQEGPSVANNIRLPRHFTAANVSAPMPRLHPVTGVGNFARMHGPTKSAEMSPSYADKSPGQGMSLNGSQCGGCSTDYDTPTEN